MKWKLEKFGGAEVNFRRTYNLPNPICSQPKTTTDTLSKSVANYRDPVNEAVFFDPCDSEIHNPLARFPECMRACERLRRAVANNERVLLYGDYDCDGVTSLTLMLDALTALGARDGRVEWLIPDRLRDGYGLKWPRLEAHFAQADEDGEPDLLIALDCGSTASPEISRLLGRGVDVIVIDHHHIGARGSLPKDEHFIHLNPWLWWNGAKHMCFCAAGITYFVANALHSGGQTPWDQERAILLAGLATCADVVPLIGLNRKLLKHSLALARNSEKLALLVPGLAKLAEIEPIDGVFNESVYSFGWGPCLNAPGRMGSAGDALRLLRANDIEDVTRYARRCVRANNWRKLTEKAIVTYAMRQAEAQLMDNPNCTIIFVCHPQWHPGVVGIVATRIRDRYHLPVFVSTSFGDGIWKGSVRSIVHCDIGKLLQKAKEAAVITEGGGHEMAGGMTFLESKRLDLHRWLERNSGLTKTTVVPTVTRAAFVSALSPREWGTTLQLLSPFGKDNECPAFLVEAAELVVVHGKTGKDPASGKIRLIGYEGTFKEISSGAIFSALWLDYELADLLWEIHRFLAGPGTPSPVLLSCHFRLELELRQFQQGKNRSTETAYNFVVRKCTRRRRLPVPKARLDTPPPKLHREETPWFLKIRTR